MKKYFLFLAFTAIQISVSFAQDIPVVTEKIIYKKVGNTELVVDMFYTASTKQKNDNTAIAFFHGGGWGLGFW